MLERGGYYWDVHAYRNSHKVRLMTWEARHVYREIIDEIWVSGLIPADPATVAVLIGTPVEVVARVWPEIEPCLKTPKNAPDHRVSERLELERKKRDKVHRARKTSGALGGKKRWAQSKAKKDETAIANAKQMLSDAKANEKQNIAITSTSTRASTSTSKGEKKEPSPDSRRVPFRDFMFDLLRTVNIEPLPTKETWRHYEDFLDKSRDKPAFELERLQEYFRRFIHSPNAYDRDGGGNHIKFFCTNVSRYMRADGTHNRLDGQPDPSETPGSTADRRTARGDRVYIPKQ